MFLFAVFSSERLVNLLPWKTNATLHSLENNCWVLKTSMLPVLLTSGCICVTFSRPLFFDLYRSAPFSLWQRLWVLVIPHSQALFWPLLEEASSSMSLPSGHIDGSQAFWNVKGESCWVTGHWRGLLWVQLASLDLLKLIWPFPVPWF